MCTQLAAAIYSPDEANMPKWHLLICLHTRLLVPLLWLAFAVVKASPLFEELPLRSRLRQQWLMVSGLVYVLYSVTLWPYSTLKKKKPTLSPWTIRRIRVGLACVTLPSETSVTHFVPVMPTICDLIPVLFCHWPSSRKLLCINQSYVSIIKLHCYP